jgi:signal transduction histidine kinase
VLLSDDFNAAFSPPLPQALVSNIVRVLGAQSVATLPLKSSNGVIGAVGFLLGKKSADIGQSSIGFMEAFTHVLGIALDNSQSFAEKERLLNDLQQKIVELEEAYRTEKDMITILAHELRTPISTASNAFQVLSTAIQPVPEKMDEAKFSQYTTIVSSQLKRLAEIVKTFMSGSETDNAKIQLNIEDVNLNEVCETAHSNFATEAGKKGLTLNKEILLNTLSVKADKNRLLEIVDNLLSNAIKYTATGGQVTVKTIVGEGGFNGISVEDTGEGIPAEDIPNLGKKYYRVNQHIQDKENALQQFTRPGGTGLGLYVSFGLAKRMGGSIQVESEVGKGSKFTLWLPKSNSNSNSQSGSINTELTSTG